MKREYRDHITKAKGTKKEKEKTTSIYLMILEECESLTDSISSSSSSNYNNNNDNNA